ncbi:capsular biosynthesis protein [Virgibacillus profundi]|uniref:Capsular biosynthesis protein n=1 Tax=Virgibacillus profundi TaxID=2024555 RepID=A0A2A2IIC0_9BACI|nr:glycosyltransferase family 1 protein [Virgibacillus profundi]PAV31549.1 capsular biosynthesis protein [Virgibacillus profundi]PXY55735.1 glycosyltransferase family 1 protein [Virgibacillus profundi]
MENFKPIKVLHVVGAMNRAGTETMLMNIYRNIDHEKIQFDFISYGKEEADYDQEIKKMGGKVIKLPKTTSLRALYRVMKEYGPYHAVHSHTLFHSGIANTAALLAGVKIRIAHAHTTLDNSDSFTRKAYIRFMRLIINSFSTDLLACSNGAGSYLFGEKALNRINYSYFPNAIDYEQFLQTPGTDVKSFKVEEGLGNNIVIGHVGRFIEAKNHSFLLEIMKSMIKKDASVKLLLVGDGDLRKQIEEKAKNEGIHENIRFTGIRSNIATAMQSMDVFVFPSLYEGLGLVLLEAQASGVPCVVSEAIQPEADINIGLVTKLSLADGADIWADKILEVAAKRERNITKIIDGFEQSGYSLRSGILALMNIYQTNTGGTYERTTNRLL